MQYLKKTVTVHKDRQGAIALMVAPQMQSCTNQITTSHHQFRSLFTNGDAKIKHVDTKKNIKDICMKPLYLDLFRYLRCKINGW